MTAEPAKLHQNRLTLAVAVVVVLTLVLRMVVYQVRDDEVAVTLTFGRATADVTGTGFKWPWPIERVYGTDYERLRDGVRHVVVHEIAHHFGISDERLRELGVY